MATSRTTDNLVGATIFWAYIVAALWFTGSIVRDIFVLYNNSLDIRASKQRSLQDVASRREKAHWFLALAVLSFATLSYQMLSFLIESYTGWAKLNQVAVPSALFGPQGILDISGRRTSLEPWRWSTASTLFQDFAQIICDDPRRFWWTQQALLYSFGWNIFMCIEGMRYRVPSLWQYFVLDQILPISFAQNLFCTAILLSPGKPRDDVLLPSSRISQRLILCLYASSLATAPAITGSAWFFLVLASVRLLLFAPYALMRPKLSSTDKVTNGGKSRTLFDERWLGTLLGLSMHVFQTWKAGPLAWRSLSDSPAVAALGYDYLIALGSLAIYMSTVKEVQ